MPGYIIHLVEAELIIDKLKREYDGICTREWEKMFRWGNVIPDAYTCEQGKKVTHFIEINHYEGKLGLIDLEKFKNEYTQELKNIKKYPEVFGYYVHLYLDKAFTERYLLTRLNLYDTLGNPIKDVYKAAEIIEVKTGERINSLDEIRNTLLKEYTSLNSYFIRKYKIEIPYNEVVNGTNKLQGLSLRPIWEKYKQFEKEEMFKNLEDIKILEVETLQEFLEKVASEIIESTKKMYGFQLKVRLKGMSNFIIENGLCSVVRLFVFFLNLAWILIRGKKPSEEDQNLKKLYDDDKQLYKKWYELWKATAQGQDMEFADWFEKIYKEVGVKYRYNERKNFAFKLLYVIILLLFVCGVAIFCIWNISLETKNLYTMVENSILFILLSILLHSVAKWIDIKKYQETWARHSKHLYLLRGEMFSYIYRLNVYDPANLSNSDEINVRFIERVFLIEQGNINKFVDNIENKECKINEDTNYLFR